MDQLQSMYFYPVTLAEVFKHIVSLNNKKSVAASSVSPYIQTALTKCFSEGIFPQSLIVAKVVPIFKDGHKTLPSNYRPISILGNLSKIYEKVIHKRLMSYLEKFSLLSENQYGFRKKKDSVQAATSLWKSIQANWEAKTKVVGIFLDFLGKRSIQ